MRTFSAIIICLLFASMSVQAQSWYIRAGLGASVTTSADYFTDRLQTQNSDETTSKKIGLGTGLPFCFAGAYMINHNVGFELGVNYFYGFTGKTKKETLNYTDEMKQQGQMLSIIPAFILALQFDKVHPYARLGLMIGVYNSFVYNYHSTSTGEKSTLASVMDFTSRDYGGIAIGAQAAVGTDFALSKKVSIFGEIQVNGISWAPKHGKFTKIEVDGVNQLPGMDKRSKEWDYVKKINNMESPSPDEPNTFSKINYKFNSVGLVVGVKINISK